MAASSSTSSSRRSASLTGLIAALVTFGVLHVPVQAMAPYFDSNSLLVKDLNEQNWQPGGDVLVLGDSRSHQGIVPIVLSERLADQGISASAFNLARPGQQLPFMYFISKDVVENAREKPKAVLLNISFYLLGGQQWMKDIYLSYYQPSISEARDACEAQLIPCEDAYSWIATSRWTPLTFRSRINTMLRTALVDPAALGQELAGIQGQRDGMRFENAAGYMTRGDEHIGPAEVTMPHGYTTGIENGYSVYLDYFDRMLDYLASQGIEVFIYQFPWPEQRKDEPGFKKLLAYYDKLLMERAAGRAHFLPTYRFWPTDFFIDPLHLNDPGARRLTAELAKELAADTDFQAVMRAG